MKENDINFFYNSDDIGYSHLFNLDFLLIQNYSEHCYVMRLFKPSPPYCHCMDEIDLQIFNQKHPISFVYIHFIEMIFIFYLLTQIIYLLNTVDCIALVNDTIRRKISIR